MWLKKLKILGIIACAIILILEAIPFGVVVKMDLSQGLSTTLYYSYFETIMVSADGDYSPFICSVISVFILILSVLSLFLKNQGAWYYKMISIFSWVGLAFSLMPLISNHFTVIGGAISALLILIAEINIVISGKIKK